MKVKKELFYTHFENGVYSDESDSEVRMIDQSDNTEDVRRRRRQSFFRQSTRHFSAKWFKCLNELEMVLF